MKPRALVFAISLAWLAAGRAAADEPVEFSHDFHLSTAGAECGSCHDTSGPGLPTVNKDGCLECHDAVPEWKLPARARRLHAAFPHGVHAKTSECADCHQQVAEDKTEAGAPLIERQTCVRCHAARKVKVPETACARCHGRNEALARPASHDGTWRARHGGEAKWRVFAEHGKDCGQCHAPSTCTACHNRLAPRDHTGLWRVRAHGVSSRWDRDRCKTCHETGTCVRCHTTTPPANHAGAWLSIHPLVAGGTANESCRACHRASFCADCHLRVGP